MKKHVDQKSLDTKEGKECASVNAKIAKTLAAKDAKVANLATELQELSAKLAKKLNPEKPADDKSVSKIDTTTKPAAKTK